MCVRQLGVEDHDDVLMLFGLEQSNYAFLLDRLMCKAYKDVFVYGEYEEKKLVSILINNDSNLSYYAQQKRGVQIYRSILPQLSYQKMSGPSDLVEAFIPLVKPQWSDRSYLGVVKQIVKQQQLQEQVHMITTKKRSRNAL